VIGGSQVALGVQALTDEMARVPQRSARWRVIDASAYGTMAT
jgi:hypothetical protein